MDTTANNIKTDIAAATSVVAGDMDNDGDTDIVAASSTDVRYYKNNGSGVFSENTVGVKSTVNPLRLADIDNDGWLDVAGLVYSATANIYWWKNNHNDTFTEQTAVAVGGNSYSSDFDIADMDNDGDLDMIASGDTSHTFYLKINSGAPNYTFTNQNISVNCGGTCIPRARSTTIGDCHITPCRTKTQEKTKKTLCYTERLEL